MKWPSPALWWRAPTVLMLLWTLAWWWLQPPSVLPVDAPEEVASGMRAVAIVHELLDGVGPHPMDTKANAEVRERLLRRLEALGLTPEVQTQTICVPRRCGTVRNIVAPLPNVGATGPLVMLTAHYDSVRSGPGYSDDGSGLGAVLEVTRLLIREPTERGVLLVLTDGEEDGLLGAQVFADSPWADRVDRVVNLDARGTTGSSYLFEIAGPTAPVVQSYAPLARSPSVSSAYVSIYRMLPNGTDVSVYKDLGWQAANLAFLGGGDRYHTPLDDRAHLDPRSVQHQVDQSLGLVRGLAGPSSGASAGDDVMFDVLGLFVVHYPTAWAAPFAGILWCVLLMGTGWRRERLRLEPTVIAGILTVVPVLVLLGLGWGLDQWWVGPGWQGVPMVPRIGLWCVALGVYLLNGRWVQWVGLPSVLVASSVWLSLLHLGLAIGLAEGSYLLLIPTFTAVTGLWAVLWLPEHRWVWAAVFSAVGGLPLLHLIQGLDTALGLSGLVVLGGAGLCLLPALGMVQRESMYPGGFSLILGVSLLGVTVGLPVATAHHPQGLILHHVQLEDEAWAFAANASFPRGGPLPPGWNFPATDLEAPFQPTRRGQVSVAVSGTDPVVEEVQASGDEIHLRIWAPGSDRLMFVLPLGAVDVRIDGVAGATSYLVEWRGEAAGLDLSFRNPNNGSVSVFAGTPVLPDGLPSVPENYVPIHEGWTSWRGVRR